MLETEPLPALLLLETREPEEAPEEDAEEVELMLGVRLPLEKREADAALDKQLEDDTLIWKEKDEQAETLKLRELDDVVLPERVEL